MTRFKTVKPVMIYMHPSEADRLAEYAQKHGIPKTQVAREGISMRMSGEKEPYNEGFNNGLHEAMRITRSIEGAKMMFPSGKSFAQLVCDEIEKFLREHK